MTRPSAVFTIERADQPAFRDPAGRLPPRFLGRVTGKLMWLPSLDLAHTYPSARAAVQSRHLLPTASRARVVQHSIH